MLYQLPTELRGQLTRPLGCHFIGSPAQTLPHLIKWINANISEFNQNPPLVISCVGDIISNTFVENEVLLHFVKYAFIDGGTQRDSDIDIHCPASFLQISYHNPAGYINEEIFEFIKKTQGDSNQYLVSIEGEEDLLVIPLILNLSKGMVFYGQPPVTDLQPPIPAGCVGLLITPHLKTQIQRLFDQFHVISE